MFLAGKEIGECTLVLLISVNILPRLSISLDATSLWLSRQMRASAPVDNWQQVGKCAIRRRQRRNA